MPNREIKDASLKVTSAQPNAANTVNSNSIDLGATTPFPVTEEIQVRVSLTASTGANNKNVNIRLQDSADNSNFANIANCPNPAIINADNNGAGHSAQNVVFHLPPVTRRYIRAVALGEANGGNSADGTFSLELLF